MKISTTKCRQFNHPEFALEADTSSVPDVYLKNVVETLEGMVANGSVFEDGQTFQIGWMITLVQKHDDGQLTLHEPDMHSMPIKWVPGITQTLRQMMVQLFTLDSVLLRQEIDIPSTRQSLLVCSQYTDASFFMERLSPSKKNNADSGWFIGCLHEDHDHNSASNLRCVSVYEAFLHQPGIQNFLAFPIGSLIRIDQKEGFKMSKNGKKLSIQSGSFLDKTLNQWASRRAE